MGTASLCRPETRPRALRGRRHRHPAAVDPGLRPHRTRPIHPVRRRRLDRRRPLVHVIDELRQPRRHHRPHPVRHIRRHRPVLGTHVHRDAADRRGDRVSGWSTSTPTTTRRPLLPDGRPEALFVCVHNAGRSQMAALPPTTPATGRRPLRRVRPRRRHQPRRRRHGRDRHQPARRRRQLEKLEDAAVEASDVVIIMGCGDACPNLTPQAVRGLGPRPPRRPSCRRNRPVRAFRVRRRYAARPDGRAQALRRASGGRRRLGGLRRS
jgi:arsenate reductase (thioredoxin)